MPIDFDTDDMIRQLRLAETDIPERLVNRIRQSGPLMIEPLLKLALDEALIHAFERTSNAPVHALRLLGDIGDARIIEPLLRAVPMANQDDTEQDPAWFWDGEMPQMLARLGSTAIEPLWAFVDRPEEPTNSRRAACKALAYMTVYDAEQREAIIAGLTRRLAEEHDKVHASYLLAALADIGVATIYTDAMAGYRAGRFDSNIIPASKARQLLLAKGSKPLACVNHSLTERYDMHPLFALE